MSPRDLQVVSPPGSAGRALGFAAAAVRPGLPDAAPGRRRGSYAGMRWEGLAACVPAMRAVDNNLKDFKALIALEEGIIILCKFLFPRVLNKLLSTGEHIFKVQFNKSLFK